MDALRKMTLMPAERVAGIAPAMKKKGRIQIGADADITVFDADTIIDNATFEEPGQFSSGVVHVLVNGTFVVKDSEPVEGASPGRAVTNSLVSSP